MSSHHIIRENQEPALLIANGQACSFELLGQLLEWSPKIVVLDGAAERVHQLGIKIDVILGDFDKALPAEVIDGQQPVQIVHTPSQEKTDLEKGIEWMIDQGYPAANIVWATGLRADHSFSNMANMSQYKNRIKLVMIDDHSVVYPLPSSFEKWYAAGSVISLVPLGKVEGISTSNLMYQLENETLELGVRNGNSNQARADGLVKISYSKGELLMMECHD